MQTSTTPTVSVSKAEAPLAEIKTYFGNAKTIFDSILANERRQKEIKQNSDININNGHFIKNRRKLLIIGTVLEALLSIRAFSFIMHNTLSIPYLKYSFLFDFAVSFVLSYLIIECTVWILNYIRNLKENLAGSYKIYYWLGHVALLIVPCINLHIFSITEEKTQEIIYLALTLLTLIGNFIIVNLISLSQVDCRFDQTTKLLKAELDKLEKEKKNLYKGFQTIRHRIEFIAPSFLKNYRLLTTENQSLVTYGVDYLYVLQNRIFAGQGVRLFDDSQINVSDYPFIERWDRVSAQQHLI